jgi:hypothetical protein
MTRPRVSAIISGIAASITAFVVVRRWGLAGTLTGAAVIPVIYAFVSHWSAEGFDRIAVWVRRNTSASGRDAPDDPASPPAAESGDRPLRRDYPTGGRRARPSGRLVGSAVLVSVLIVGVALGVYSLAHSPTTAGPNTPRSLAQKAGAVTSTTQSHKDDSQPGSTTTTTRTTVTTKKDGGTSSTSSSSTTSASQPDVTTSTTVTTEPVTATTQTTITSTTGP